MIDDHVEIPLETIHVMRTYDATWWVCDEFGKRIWKGRARGVEAAAEKWRQAIKPDRGIGRIVAHKGHMRQAEAVATIAELAFRSSS